MFEVFIIYCCEVVICCIVFDLCKVCDCVYMFEGLVIVFVNIDLIIELICKLLILVEVKVVLIVCFWELGIVKVMFEKVGEDNVVCFDWLVVDLGICDG